MSVLTLKGSDGRSKRKDLELLRIQLEQERSSFMPLWRDIGDYLSPMRPRFQVTDTNRGDRKNTKIIDSTGTLSSRTCRSGMMGGVTSPARPWFRLTTPDPDLAEFAAVKDWLHIVSQRMVQIFLRSNLYKTLPTVYGDMADFATAAMSLEEEFNGNVIHTHPFPIGSYCIGVDEFGRVNVFHRKFRMNVRQLVARFVKDNDWSNVSTWVKNAWNEGNTEQWVDIYHCVRPNEEWKPGSPFSKQMRFSSCYYEAGTATGANGYFQPGDEQKLLSEKGYNYFPVLAPRWEVTGEDSYGTNCPGIMAIGDVKQLQLGEKRGMQAIEKMVNPPMVAHAALRNQRASILPGDTTYVDIQDVGAAFRPAHEVSLRLEALESKQESCRFRIKRAYFEDLFLMLSQTDRREITAREVDEKHEEKLLALGPVLENLNQDLLDPLIDNVFEIMDRQGLVPEAPEELQGVPLKVEYISVMAQAQKLIGIGSIDRFAGFVGNLATQLQNPELIDKIDTDQLIDIYGDLCSVPPGIVRPDEDVESLRAGRQKQIQAQQSAEAMQQTTGAVKNLAQADMSGENALNALLGQAQAGSITTQ